VLGWIARGRETLGKTKKQAILIRIPGIIGYSQEKITQIGEQVRITLQQQFEKEVVVLIVTDDIHFMDESDIRDMIDTLENIIKWIVN